MAGSSKDPKGHRITIRITDWELGALKEEARRTTSTVGAVVRALVRGTLPRPNAARHPKPR